VDCYYPQRTRKNHYPSMWRGLVIAWARNRPRVVSKNLFAPWVAKTFTSTLDHQTCPSPHHSRIYTHPRMLRFGHSSLVLADPCCVGSVPFGTNQSRVKETYNENIYRSYEQS
jgi:hypothetical protein